MPDHLQPRFARIWRGRTPRDKADAYQAYWLENGVKPLKARGALNVRMLREDRPADTEFVTISLWNSLEAMTGGAGGDPTLTHHLAKDSEYLIELPTRVQVLKILDSDD